MAKTCKVCNDAAIDKWTKKDVLIQHNSDNDTTDDDTFLRLLICPKCGAVKIKDKNIVE